MKQVHSTPQRALGKIRLGIDRLLGRYPFHAKVLEQFKIVASPNVGTMGVTVRQGQLLLLYDPQFVLDMRADELGGVLVHEVHHIVLKHVMAVPKDYPDEWARTVAEEVTVNEYVKELLPEGAITLSLFPQLPPLESTQERYQRLRKVKDRVAIEGLSSASLNAAVIGGTAALPAKGGKETVVGAARLIDNHAIWQEAQADPDAVRDAIRAVLQQAALEAGTDGLPEALRAGLHAHGVGTEAGDGRYDLLGGRKGRLDWRRLLRRFVGAALEHRQTLGRPPRRFPSLAGVVPALTRRPRRSRVMAVIDTSGSIHDELLELIDGELRRLGGCHTVTVVECDAVVHRIYKYRPLDCVWGRGGTDLRPPLEPEFLRNHRPDLIVYFTDGFGPTHERGPRLPVIWCLVPGGEPPASWGQVIRMETE